MNWQNIAVAVIVIAAAIYAARIFFQQFRPGKRAEAEQCAHCAPDKKARGKAGHFENTRPD